MTEGRAPATAPPSGGGYGGGRGSSSGDKSEGIRSIVRAVGEKTFYLSNGTWYDQAAGEREESVKVKSMSDAYFALLKENPGLGKYFALGTRVVVSHGGMTYEVME